MDCIFTKEENTVYRLFSGPEMGSGCTKEKNIVNRIFSGPDTDSGNIAVKTCSNKSILFQKNRNLKDQTLISIVGGEDYGEPEHTSHCE